MAVYFLDSSALVKRYISETGSAWVLRLCDLAQNNEIMIAAITGVEIIAAITRRSRSGSILSQDAIAVCDQFKNDLQSEYQVVEITEGIINSAIELAQIYGLRGYDAVQLAACLAVNALCIANGLPPMTLVSADAELNTAAASEHIFVENPNNYP
ncbi:type II toxin-antitoxin system VapC family toxin [Nostoc sp. FACHB-152]|uniref:type II toxin-antitoxin system VapC family toxin n=1 Tax=unclassified Nostoc TaxID=2593658 RepID=UPI001685C795|nr:MULTISPECIES: type II toxin-antitoxin system VapC family toxin [unclassified Nostoc]MBD2449715.1 type II toxin-antitoxin system VapC family toxin [Nostoc sp. FACHB-152]MBD2469065.1 type II toxin-antitoxin system VapC family toxin [Nostoc sp. FACHB-145]